MFVFTGRQRFAACVFLLVLAGVIILIRVRQRSVDRQIESELVALRRAGIPTTYEDLARRYPSPPAELEAALVFAKVFQVATNSRLPGSAPVVNESLTPARTEPLTPAVLNDLVPEYLPSAPVDPFDGKPLRFKKRNTGFIVYSIGADGTDNGGTERTNTNVKSSYDVPVIIER